MQKLIVDTPNVRVGIDDSDKDFPPVICATEKVKGESRFVFYGTPDEFIYWLFNSRCIMCKRSATEINEITPRSRSKDAIRDFRNRVTLCPDCHRKFHDGGVTDEKQKLMRMSREIFLIALGRKDYI